MKIIKSLTLFLIFSKIIFCEYYCDGETSEPNVENCKKLKKGDGYCCYTEAPKSSESKFCQSISKYEYDNIKDYVKFMKKFGGDEGETEDKDAKIDCKSFYLKFSSIILLLLFFL